MNVDMTNNMTEAMGGISLGSTVLEQRRLLRGRQLEKDSRIINHQKNSAKISEKLAKKPTLHA